MIKVNPSSAKRANLRIYESAFSSFYSLLLRSACGGGGGGGGAHGTAAANVLFAAEFKPELQSNFS